MERLWLFVHVLGDVVTVREVRDADEGVRVMWGLNGIDWHSHKLVAGCRNYGYFLVRAATQTEAERQGDMLVDGTHPDQHEIEYDHALLRAGLRGDALKGPIFACSNS